MSCTITLDDVREKLKGRVLKSGSHIPPTDGANCDMCVRELRAFMCGLPFSDHPDGDIASPTDRACQSLNDAIWSTDEARTSACAVLAVLSEHTAPGGWVAKYAELTIRTMVPIAMRAAASAIPSHREQLEAAALRCETEGTEDAAWAAGDAAGAARAAGDAGDAAGDAARAAGDEALRVGVRVLLEAHGRQDLVGEIQ